MDHTEGGEEDLIERYILVHIYAGIWIRGTLGAMLHGTVTPGWAHKHHPRWFRSVAKERAAAKPSTD